MVGGWVVPARTRVVRRRSMRASRRAGSQMTLRQSLFATPIALGATAIAVAPLLAQRRCLSRPSTDRTNGRPAIFAGAGDDRTQVIRLDP
jgi:hypothetical protein